MHSPIALGAFALMAGSAAAKIVQINVGESGFVFSPNTSTADVGDTIEFHFYSNFHTAVQGDYSTPCMRGSLENTGFSSGPISNMPNGGPNVFQVSVTSTDPIWFYCATPSHCQSGMAGVVNPPSSSDSLAMYVAAAAAMTTSSEGTSSAEGGNVVPLGTQPSAASGSSSAAPPASSSMASSVASSSVASSMASSVVSVSTSASVAAGATSATSAGSTSSSSVATSSPTTAKTSGAGWSQGSIFAAQETLAGLAVGLGLLVYLMA